MAVCAFGTQQRGHVRVVRNHQGQLVFAGPAVSGNGAEVGDERRQRTSAQMQETHHLGEGVSDAAATAHQGVGLDLHGDLDF